MTYNYVNSIKLCYIQYLNTLCHFNISFFAVSPIKTKFQFIYACIQSTLIACMPIMTSITCNHMQYYYHHNENCLKFACLKFIHPQN